MIRPIYRHTYLVRVGDACRYYTEVTFLNPPCRTPESFDVSSRGVVWPKRIGVELYYHRTTPTSILSVTLGMGNMCPVTAGWGDY